MVPGFPLLVSQLPGETTGAKAPGQKPAFSPLKSSPLPPSKRQDLMKCLVEQKIAVFSVENEFHPQMLLKFYI